MEKMVLKKLVDQEDRKMRIHDFRDNEKFKKEKEAYLKKQANKSQIINPFLPKHA
jgi:hypothetical protein